MDNIEDQDSQEAVKLKQKLGSIAKKQKIYLFDEEEIPDPDLITNEMIFMTMSNSLDLIQELLTYSEVKKVEEPAPQKIVSMQYIDFGITLAEMKQMQQLSRGERKKCHHTIVEIEKLMYELSSIIDSGEDINRDNLKQLFHKTLETYLLLPHCLKPIFDHCKKIENLLTKALKSQQEQISLTT